MLTIFCSPKPFIGETAWNQLNAMRSWRAIHPDLEMIIFGASAGVAEAAVEVGAVWVPEIEGSPTGAPLFNAMAEYARLHGRHAWQVYVNADILLNASVCCAMQAASQRFNRFLLVGERMDLAQGVTLDTRQLNWPTQILALAQARQLTAHGPTGTDYFGFVRGMWQDLPPVFMGRAMCDQALLHDCFNHQIDVIDATLAVTAVHQFHDYQHVAGGFQQVFYGEDKVGMMKAHGLRSSLPTIADADWRLVEDGAMAPDRYRRRMLRRVELALRYRFRLGYAALGVRALQRLMGTAGTLPRNLPEETVVNTWTRTTASRCHTG